MKRGKVFVTLCEHCSENWAFFSFLTSGHLDSRLCNIPSGSVIHGNGKLGTGNGE